MITLSVIVPVRDGEAYLGDALASLARNRTREFETEVVVVDDGSADATADVAEDFRRDLPGLSLVRNAAPLGLADARNAGLKLASGRYVTFLDADDWLAPGYLPRLVAAIEGLGCDFVRVDHVQAEGRKRETHRAPQPRRGVVLDPRESILPAGLKTMVDYPYAWAGIYRRELGDLLAFPSGLHTAEDRPWIWRLHRLARSYAVVSLAGLFYRRGLPASLTQIGDERQLHFFDAYDIVLDETEPRYLPKAARNLCALLAHHAELAERFTPAVRARFDERARAALARLPRETLTEAIGGLEPERAALLGPYLPGGPSA
ncbi:glycosyltransferase family 2 protein [Microbispora triticiradicis]|uniref:Glycosyltransferase family 2 protein n=1 Tax=Microbispora triticiradicis TaxID=2200763 RepID=A0ABX9LJ70_9ACTN|nr:glycosyltransferase family 2 protein [Microbispora triticiradicis]RGA03676.1 glycosyltransferase family 2 protein [Microbispora triticiradicis]GLW22968.1 glycosyl transferase [Microbispora amethystogenes]